MAILLQGRATHIRGRWGRVRFTFTRGDWPGGIEQVTLPRRQFDPSIREGDLVETIIPGGMPDFHLPDGTPVFASVPPANARTYRRAVNQGETRR